MGLLIQALAFYLKRINMDLNFVLIIVLGALHCINEYRVYLLEKQIKELKSKENNMNADTT